MDTEEWRSVPGCEGYEASSMGRVRGRRGPLASFKMSNGYLKISLGRARQTTVHAVVAAAFLGPRPRGWCVAHKNSVRDDNRIENLQYTTYRGNQLHGRRDGTRPCPLIRSDNMGRPRIGEIQRGRKARGEAHGMAEATEAEARQVHQLASFGLLRRDIAALMGLSYVWVAHVASGRRWRHIHPDTTLRK